MRTVRFAVFGLVLAGGVALAVSTLVAQSRRDLPNVMMMLDGWGRQLGVSVRDLDADGQKASGAANGVRIDRVSEDGPAAKAGLKEGDVVADVDGEQVRSARQFSRLIQETPAGKSVKLGVLRNGSRQSIDVMPEPQRFAFDVDGQRMGRDVERSLRDLEPRLRELEPRLRELEPRMREMEPLLRERLRDLEPRMREFRYQVPDFDFDFNFDDAPRTGRLGVQLGELTPQLADYFGVKDGGVLVSSVGRDSPAEKAGLKAGDVITSINGDRVRRTRDLVEALRDNAGELAIGVVRDKKEQSLKAAAR